MAADDGKNKKDEKKDDAKNVAKGPPKEDMNDEMKGWIYLGELTESDFQDGLWPIKKNGKTGKKEGKDKEWADIKVEGVLSPHGIGMHPPNNGKAGLAFALDRRYSRFKGKVAINDDGEGFFGPAVFEIIADKKTRLWQSKPVKSPGRVQEFDIDVSNVRTLAIQTISPQFSNGLHAVWVEPMLKIKEEAKKAP